MLCSTNLAGQDLHENNLGATWVLTQPRCKLCALMALAGSGVVNYGLDRFAGHKSWQAVSANPCLHRHNYQLSKVCKSLVVVEQHKVQLQDEFYGSIRTRRPHMCSIPVYILARVMRVGGIMVHLLQRQLSQESSWATECESPRQ